MPLKSEDHQWHFHLHQTQAWQQQVFDAISQA
jgi:hypothetical protein